MQSKRPSIKLVIPLNGRWASLEELRISAQELWEYYLIDAENGEVLAAAILVSADGVPWNSEEHSECLYHIESWLSATAAIYNGQTHRGVFAWEESGMEMRREGSAVILEERTHHKHMQLKPVYFDLREFSKALISATGLAAEVLVELKKCAAHECGEEWRQLSIEWRQYVGEQEIRLMSQEEFDHHKALADQSDDALQKAMFLGYRPKARPKGRRGERLAHLLDYLRQERFTSYWNQLSNCLAPEASEST